MIQLNLLPDIKVEFIKAKRLKRMVIVVAILTVGISVTLLVVTLSLTALQKKHISDLNTNIKKSEKELQDVPDLAKILTIQNQLNSLPALYAQRPVSSRLLPYIEQLTPTTVIGISKLLVDFAESSFTIEGTGQTFDAVNKYVDTLKFTKYTVKPAEGQTQADPKYAFSEVVLSTFSRDSKEAGFTIKLKYDTVIFDAAQEVTLSVPTAVTTRSETSLPTGVFDTKVKQ